MQIALKREELKVCLGEGAITTSEFLERHQSNYEKKGEVVRAAEHEGISSLPKSQIYRHSTLWVKGMLSNPVCFSSGARKVNQASSKAQPKRYTNLIAHVYGSKTNVIPFRFLCLRLF